MNRFLYYLPLPGANPKMLADRGLLGRFTGPRGLLEHCVVGTDTGPAGRGCIVALGTQPAEYEPLTSLTGRQRWLEGPDGQYWVGVDTDAIPSPDELIRQIVVEGPTFELADGQLWRIPRLRLWDAERLAMTSTLPKTLGVVAGRVVSQVAPGWQAAEALAERTWGRFAAGAPVPIAEVFSDVCELLALNYRIGQEEAAILGILTEEVAVAVLELAIDLPSLRRQAAQMATEGLAESEPTGPVEPVITDEVEA